MRRLSISDYIKELISSAEFEMNFINKLAQEKKIRENYSGISSIDYLFPNSLSKTQDNIKNILLVSSCFGQSIKDVILNKTKNSVVVDHYFNSSLGDFPLSPIENYDFQIVQISSRSIIADLDFVRLSQSNDLAHNNLFEHCKNAVKYWFEESTKWNKKFRILTFVLSFVEPQQNFVGRLFERYRISNPKFFIEKLNEYLSELCTESKNIYFLDVNEVASSLGKRFSYEDHVAAFNHGSIINDHDITYNRPDRTEVIERLSHYYETNVEELLFAIYKQICFMYRTIRQTDSVKMVVVDLDDTLWNGTVGEVNDPSLLSNQEGWPIGFWEALLVLKRRGIILSIISKNSEEIVRKAWSSIVNNNLKLDDFAVIKINFEYKSKNMKEILEKTNILPRNVVYIDDNPVQRLEISNLYPEIRTLGGTPNIWRHILLWASETQVQNITGESENRSEMIKAQLVREEERGILTPDEFLLGLDLRLSLFPVGSTSHSRFSRVLELVNKTNQFNTTGIRWREEDILAGLSNGLKIFAFDVTDKFTNYGLVGVFFVEDNTITQFVMSCRVLGLGIERAGVLKVIDLMRGQGASEICAILKETERNQPCRSVYHSIGFSYSDGLWRLPKGTEFSSFSHVRVEVVLE